MDSIRDILVKRDNMSPEEADNLIQQAKDDLFERLGKGEMPDDICEEWFGLEPDYIEELL